MDDQNLAQVLTASVPNLDWLDIDEEAYQAMGVLPKQNLDIRPDLEALWNPDSSLGLVPNTGAPRTMLDLAPQGPRDPHPDAVVRTARLLAMQGATSTPALLAGLLKRFSKEQVKQAGSGLKAVIADRGLLGSYYLNSADFPQCNSKPDQAAAFAGRYAKSARYVVCKSACEGCQHLAGSVCSVFQKLLVPAVPFTEADAETIEKFQRARGLVASTVETDPRKRIQAALLATTKVETGFTGNPNTGALIPASRLVRKAQDPTQQAEEAQKVKVAKAAPIVAMVQRELLKGRSQADVANSLKLSFDAQLLLDTADQWQPTYKQAGLFGTVYVPQEAFADCREGANFLGRHASRARVVVAGSKCAGCRFAVAGACQTYKRRLVASIDEALTPDAVQWVLDGHRTAGTLPWDAHQQAWGTDPKQALQAIHKAATSKIPYVQAAPQRALVERSRLASQASQQTSSLTVREIAKVASQLMNEGLFGTHLQMALKKRFDPRDLVAAASELRSVLAEQGLQGIHYIDPTPYTDYGQGCKEAARLHRTRVVKVAKAGPKCAGCLAQQVPGQCSVLAKRLVAEPTYEPSKAEVQRAILASDNVLSVNPADLVNNGASMLAEFQMQQEIQDVDLKPEKAPEAFGLEWGTGTVTF